MERSPFEVHTQVCIFLWHCVEQWPVLKKYKFGLHSFLWFFFLVGFCGFFSSYIKKRTPWDWRNFIYTSYINTAKTCFLDVEWSNCAKLHGGLEIWINVYCRLDSFLPKPQFHLAHCEVKNLLWCQQASLFCAKQNCRGPYKGLTHQWFPLCTVYRTFNAISI